MSDNSIESDLAYLRGVAEAGHEAPLLGGRFSVWWGGLVTATLALHWALLHYLIPDGGPWLGMLWLGFSIVGVAGSLVLGRSIRSKPGRGSAANRVEAAVWASIGLMIFLYFAAITTGVVIGRLETVMFGSITPVALLGYGAAWLTVAIVSRRTLYALPGLVALAGGFLATIVMGSAVMFLVAAVTALTSVFLPGLLLLRREGRMVDPDHAPV